MNVNGFISFDNPVIAVQPSFSDPLRWISSSAVIAPFWADIDLNNYGPYTNPGKIFYRCISRRTKYSYVYGNDKIAFNDVQRKVIQYIDYTATFTPTMICTFTWSNVSPYPFGVNTRNEVSIIWNLWLRLCDRLFQPITHLKMHLHSIVNIIFVKIFVLINQHKFIYLFCRTDCMQLIGFYSQPFFKVATFQLVLTSDNSNGRSYAIFSYEYLGWNYRINAQGYKMDNSLSYLADKYKYYFRTSGSASAFELPFLIGPKGNAYKSVKCY